MKKILAMILTIASVVYAENGCQKWGCVDGFEIGGEWLYWKTYQDNMEYAVHVNSFSVNETQFINADPLTPKFHADNGFRVFANAYFCQSSWSIGAIFTRIAAKAKNSTNADPANPNENFISPNVNLFPIFTVLANGGNTFSRIDSRWSSELNYFDLDFAREISFCTSFAIVPHLGFRTLWFKQKLSLFGLLNNTPVLLDSIFVEDYVGFGVEGGLTASFQLPCGFSIVGHLGSSLLYAKVEVNEEFTLSSTESSTLIRAGDLNFYHLTPTMDGFIGLQYLRACGCGLIDLHIGWEQHIVFNANYFSVNYANLTLQGLTLGGSFTF